MRAETAFYLVNPACWSRIFTYIPTSENISSQLALWPAAGIAEDRLGYRLGRPKLGVLVIRCLADDAKGFEKKWKQLIFSRRGVDGIETVVEKLMEFTTQSAQLQYEAIGSTLIDREVANDTVKTLILDTRILQYIPEGLSEIGGFSVFVDVNCWAKIINDVSVKFAASIQHLIFIEDDIKVQGSRKLSELWKSMPPTAYQLVRLDQMLATMCNLRVVYLPNIREYELAHRSGEHGAWEALENLAPESRMASVQLIVLKSRTARDSVLLRHGGNCTLPDLPAFSGLLTVALRTPVNVNHTPFRQIGDQTCCLREEISEVYQFLQRYVDGRTTDSAKERHANIVTLQHLMADITRRTTSVWQVVHGNRLYGFNTFNYFGDDLRIFPDRFERFGEVMKALAPFGSGVRLLSSYDTGQAYGIIRAAIQLYNGHSQVSPYMLDRKRLKFSGSYRDNEDNFSWLVCQDRRIAMPMGEKAPSMELLRIPPIEITFSIDCWTKDRSGTIEISEIQRILDRAFDELKAVAVNSQQCSCGGSLLAGDFRGLVCCNLRKLTFSLFSGSDNLKKHCSSLEVMLMDKKFLSDQNCSAMGLEFGPLPMLKAIRVR